MCKNVLVNLTAENDMFCRTYQLGLDQDGHGYCYQSDSTRSDRDAYRMTYMDFEEVFRIRDEILNNPAAINYYCWGCNADDCNLETGCRIEGDTWVC